MKWTELSIKMSVENLDRARDILLMITQNGMYIEDYSDIEMAVDELAIADMINEELLNKDRTTGIIHLYLAPEENPDESRVLIEEKLKAEHISAQISENILDEEDWANNWKQYFKPFRVGEKIVIKPEWEEYERRDGDEYVLNIDPGMAFGTGTHATTRMCIVLLERFMGKYVSKREIDVLDVGTGSGILAIAAILLGARSALGIDTDKYAIKKAIENAALNSVGDRVDFRIGDLANGIEEKYDIICANIVADVIIKLAADAARLLNPGGIFICSGIIDSREGDIASELNRCGFGIVETLREECWAAIAARRNG